MAVRSVALPVLVAVTVGLVASAHGAGWQFIEDDASPPFAVAGVLSVTDPAALDLRLAACGDDREALTSYYLLQITSGRAAIARVADGARVTLAEAPAPPIAAGSKLHFAVHRDGWRLALILDHTVVAKAWDPSLTGAAFGYEVVAGATVDDILAQGIGETAAADTFEREEGAKDDWTVLAGSWEHVSLREDRQAGQMQADKTTNAFSYTGRSKGAPGLATTGPWYWRNCSYSVAVRLRGRDSAAGLAIYVQDKDNYLVLRADCRAADLPGGPVFRLLSVRDGDPTVLAQASGGLLPEQWYRLRATACDDRICCYVDDELLLSAQTDALGQGAVGMYVEGAEGTSFDDLLVTNYNDMAEDFWSVPAGKWQATGGWLVGKGTLRYQGKGPGTYVTGDPTWSGCVVSARFAWERGVPGLIAGYQSATDYYVFRWANSAGPEGLAARAQLIHVSDAGEEVLDEQALAPDPPNPVQARLEVQPGLMAGYLGARLVVSAPLPAPAIGQIGVCARGAGDVTVSALSLCPVPQRRAARVVKEFTDSKEHFEMAEWASTRHAWVQPREGAQDQTWWTKGDFYGPLEIRVPLTGIGTASGTMTISLRGEEGGGAAPASLSVTCEKGSQSIALSLASSSATLASASVEAAEGATDLVIAVEGQRVVVSLGEAQVLQAVIPATMAQLSTAAQPAPPN
jgi:hypothetical protein